MLRNFDDFVETIVDAGFSMGGGNSEGIFAAVPWGWNEQPPYDTPVAWHTGDKQTDPWEWRMRVLEEREDIAYAKVFFKKSGFITKSWYPYFWAARRGNGTFENIYFDGKISHFAKRIYEVISHYEVLPLHEIKQQGGFSKEDKSAFDRALVELQMNMFITMCGQRQKISSKGDEYGWSATVFCTPEKFFGEEMVEQAAKISKDEAREKITQQILRLNPEAKEKKMEKFIFG